MNDQQRHDTNAPQSATAPSDSSSAIGETLEAQTEAPATESVDSAAGSAQTPAAAIKGGTPIPPRPFRRFSLIPCVLSAVIAFLLMAHSGRVAIGIPLGLACVVVFALSLMDFLGTFDLLPLAASDAALETDTTEDAGEPVAAVTKTWPVPLRALTPSFVQIVLAFILFAVSLASAGYGFMHRTPIVWALLVPGTFLWFVASIFSFGQKLGPYATDENGEARPLFKRHGFWVVVLGTLLYMPMMGLFSLWDPWETHYGEVAREIIARDDWISLWWAQDGWFWSKPILNFWMQSLAMGSLGTGATSDHMLLGVAPGFAHPEWVVRAPNVLLTIVAMYLLYKGVARVFGRRAGLLGGIALATMPDWYFLAHQTMADMPCIAPLTAAMGLAMLGIYTKDAVKVRAYPVNAFGRVLNLTGWHLAMLPIMICAMPQVFYLLSRNLELVLHGSGPHGLRMHWDEFQNGSAINCGLPGNEPCRTVAPAAVARVSNSSMQHLFLGFEPVLQGLLWFGCLLGLLLSNLREVRLSRLYFIAAAFFCSLAMMGKGPLGIVVPAGTAIVTLMLSRRWTKLPQLEWGSFLLVLACVAAPWFVAMYVRHGAQFVDRLFYHDMINRTLGHVHDTNEGDDTSFRFYIWQLGYALFPWTGLVPFGLLQWLRRGEGTKGNEEVTGPRTLASLVGGFAFWRTSDEQHASDKATGHTFLVVWFVLVFALVSFMGTKFHHYVFPAVPPLAMLVGIALDDFLGDVNFARGKQLVLELALAAGSAVALTVGGSLFFPGEILGNKPKSGVLAGALAPQGAAFIIAGIALFAGSVFLSRRFAAASTKVQSASTTDTAKSIEAIERAGSHGALLSAAAVVAGAFLMVLIGRDLAIHENTGDQPGAIRLLQLFTYNYRRAWPTESIDFTAILSAFTILAVVLYLLFGVRAIRKQVVTLFVAFACIVAFWGTDVYIVKLAPHWGQRELFEAYYKDRKGPDEQVVAYQMNWKGENFYTSNRIPAFVSSGATFTTWLKAQRDKGQKVMYFVTEHSRVGGLRSEVSPKDLKEITDKRINNKFVLVRVEL